MMSPAFSSQDDRLLLSSLCPEEKHFVRAAPSGRYPFLISSLPRKGSVPSGSTPSPPTGKSVNLPISNGSGGSKGRGANQSRGKSLRPPAGDGEPWEGESFRGGAGWTGRTDAESKSRFLHRGGAGCLPFDRLPAPPPHPAVKMEAALPPHGRRTGPLRPVVGNRTGMPYKKKPGAVLPGVRSRPASSDDSEITLLPHPGTRAAIPAGTFSRPRILCKWPGRALRFQSPLFASAEKSR